MQIDADLFPTKAGSTRLKWGSSQSAVLTGLAGILENILADIRRGSELITKCFNIALKVAANYISCTCVVIVTIMGMSTRVLQPQGC